MGRGPKPTKGKAKPAAGRSRKSDGSTDHDLELRLAAALRREKEALEQQTATAEILRVIASSPTSVQPVFDAIAENAARLCSANDAQVLRVDGEVLRLVSAVGASAIPEVRQLTRAYLVGRAVIDRQTIHVPDIAQALAEYPETTAPQYGVQSLLAVPLLRDGVALGAIRISRTEMRPFTDNQILLLQTFADQAVIAIENVRLFTELDARNRDLAEALDRQTATSEILRVVASSPTDLQPVFSAIAESAKRLLGGFAALITRLIGEDLHLGALTSTSPAGDEAARARFPRAVTTFGIHTAAARTRAPFVVADIESDQWVSHPGLQEMARARGWRSFVAVPMLQGGQMLGTIGVSRPEAGAFKPQEIALLETFADQAVIAIENVRLFTELEEKNRALTAAHEQISEAFERQTATADILGVISRSPTDVQPVFDAILTSAVGLLGAFSGTLTRIAGEQIELAAITSTSDVGDAFLRTQFPQALSSAGPHARTIRDRAPLNIAEAQTDPRLPETVHAIARVRGYRSQVFVPLLRHDEAIGAISLTRAEPGGFTIDEIGLLQSFADQAVIAIENVRLFKELETRNRDLTEALDQQTATAEILKVISGSPTDVQPVFDTIVRSATRLLDGHSANVLTVAKNELHVAAMTTMSAAADAEARATFPVPLAEAGVATHVIRTRRPHIVADIETDPLVTTRLRHTASLRGYRSMLTVPMVHHTQVIGVISVTRRSPGAFGEDEVAILKTFADQAVIAIENVRLFTELQEKNTALTQAHAQVTESLEQQTATAEILRVISSSPTDVQPVFQVVIENAVRLCGGVFGRVFRREGQTISLAANQNFPDGARDFPRPLQDDETLGGRVARTGQVIRSADVEADPSIPATALTAFRGRRVRSVLVVPIAQQGETLGSIVVGHADVAAFSDAHVALLKTFADQAVIAIENVRLFKELEIRNGELTQALDRETATGEILRVINSSPTSAEPVFDAILANGMRLCQADVGLLFLVEGDTFRLVADRGASPEFVEPRRTAHRSGPHTGIARAVQERRPIHIEDLLVDRAYIERDPARLQTIELLGARSGVWVPLLKEDMAIGVLVTWRREVRRFTDAEIEVLTTFANQAVIAIENVRLLRDLDEKSRQLEVASQHKSEFLANMSHELRTPLNAIIGFSEVLSERMFGELNEKQEEYSKDIHASGQHLLSLINDILDLSKIEAGRMELELSDFDLPTAIDNALMLVRERAGRRSLTLHKNIDGGVGEVRADERKIRQVVLNLLSNAIKFTLEGGRIAVAAVPRDGSVEVSVSDTGVGIAPEDHEAVFQEFRQVGTAEKKAEGTGLGLTLCRKFIELHGGKIWVKSQLGAGSTFTFTIPVRRGE